MPKLNAKMLMEASESSSEDVAPKQRRAKKEKASERAQLSKTKKKSSKFMEVESDSASEDLVEQEREAVPSRLELKKSYQSNTSKLRPDQVTLMLEDACELFAEVPLSLELFLFAHNC